jgi:hypothetical protein
MVDLLGLGLLCLRYLKAIFVAVKSCWPRGLGWLDLGTPGPNLSFRIRVTINTTTLRIRHALKFAANDLGIQLVKEMRRDVQANMLSEWLRRMRLSFSPLAWGIVPCNTKKRCGENATARRLSLPRQMSQA